ncbi:hypothetical protein PHMEG_00035147 [Phytophthora megakarya]|uniref:Uncharacterized protein n=1 Tax=Phytophthora megakarya TaxID=4795 RepID=A0A225UPU3_9STRA|nr:hypothetical protein PHMEG_00035147 [Phytophthora megakarya]
MTASRVTMAFSKRIMNRNTSHCRTRSKMSSPNWTVNSLWLLMSELSSRLASSATRTISRLEKAKQAKGFDADKLMTFVHENQGSIRGRWTCLRHLLRHFERGTQPPAGWKTWLTVEAADKPYRAMPPFPNVPDHDSEASDDEEIVVSDGDDVPDQESNSKSEENPPAASLPSELLFLM